MTGATDEELIEHWRVEPAPLLPLLHAFHDRDGDLSKEALRVVSDGLDIPSADLFGTVTQTAELKVCPVRITPV